MPHLLPKKQNKIQPANKKASANFSGAQIRGAHFPAGGIFVSGLAGQHIPFRRQPANTSRHHSFHTGPQSSTSQLPSSRLGRPTPYIPSNHFFNIYKAPSSHQVSLPTILPLIFLFPFFHFLYCVQHPPGLHLFVPPTPISSHHFPNSLHFFRPAAASPTRRPNAKRSFARGCSLQGCRWCGRGARVSFFFLFLFFSASLFSLFFSISLAPRLRRDAFIFLFTFVLIFVFSFFLFAFIFAFFFLLFSIYFSSDFLFLFFLCSFFLLFLSFYFCSYLCFFVFLFLFLFYFYLCLLYFFSLFFFLVFIFASPFLFCLSFCFTFLPSSLQFLSLLSNRSPAIRFFSPAANFSHPIQPLPAAAKRKKISAKESTGVRWPSGSERATEGKVEGQDGMN